MVSIADNPDAAETPANPAPAPATPPARTAIFAQLDAAARDRGLTSAQVAKAAHTPGLDGVAPGVFATVAALLDSLLDADAAASTGANTGASTGASTGSGKTGGVNEGDRANKSDRLDESNRPGESE